MIGSCDCCDRQSVPISNIIAIGGLDTSACYICQGLDEIDPYGELEIYDSKKLIALAEHYLANNAAESGADALIRDLADALRRSLSATSSGSGE